MEYYQMRFKKNETSSKTLHLNTLARGSAHHDAALPEQALCGLGFGEHHVAELNLSLAMDKPSVDNNIFIQTMIISH